jgi:putative acetyltransferase
MGLHIKIREGKPGDGESLKQLFRDTVKSICANDYNEEQIKVWVAGAENSTRWNTMLVQQYVLVAETNGIPAGFGTLDKGYYIDMFYIHKDYQRMGIARQLFEALMAEALRLEQTRLTADVSLTARPFFEKMGFNLLALQTVIRQGVALNNFRMEKEL